MTWDCAECQAAEGQRTSDGQPILIDSVCHHCGKLLCRPDRRVFADAAFDPAGGEADQAAVHCQACSRQHHGRIDSLFGRPGQ